MQFAPFSFDQRSSSARRRQWKRIRFIVTNGPKSNFGADSFDMIDWVQGGGGEISIFQTIIIVCSEFGRTNNYANMDVNFCSERKRMVMNDELKYTSMWRPFEDKNASNNKINAKHCSCSQFAFTFSCNKIPQGGIYSSTKNVWTCAMFNGSNCFASKWQFFVTS